MQKYDFIIGYEHRNREIESICLLKYELERRGFRVFIFCIYDERMKDYVNKYQTNVLLLPYCYTDDSFIKCVKRSIVFDKIINLQWEQAIYRQQEEDPNSFKNPSGICLKAVHVSWGEANVKRLTEVAGVCDSNVRLTGNITLDFLRKPLTEYYLSRDDLYNQYNIPKDKKICLLIASFKSATLGDAELEKLCEMYGEWRREHHFIAKRSRDTILEWIERSLEEDENIFFIYRPHPAENTEYVSQIAQRCNRFVVIGERSVKQWILAVDRIYTWMSTTVAEIYFSGQNCFILYPYALPEIANARLFDHAHTIKEYGTFKQSLYSGQSEFPVTKQDINDYYLVSDEMSYIKVADVCEDVYYDGQYSISQADKVSVYDLLPKPKTLLKRLNNFLWRQDAVYHIFWKVAPIFPKTKYFNRWIRDKKTTDALLMTEYVSDDEMEAIGRRIKECLER